jgi:hypothetical protein
MSEQVVSIVFETKSMAEDGRLAANLADHIRQTLPETRLKLDRNDPNTMDLGTTLSLVLAAPAAVALAKGIADWMRRQAAPKLVIITDKGRIEVAGDLPADDKREIILEALRGDAV